MDTRDAILLLHLALLCVSGTLGQQSAQATTAAPRRSYAQAAHNPAQQDSSLGGNQPAQGSPQPAAGNVPSYSQAAQGQQNRPAEGSPQPAAGNAPSYSQAAQNRPASPAGSQGAGSRPANTYPTPYPSHNRGYVRPTVASRTPINNVTDDDLRAFSDDLLRVDTNNAGSTVRTNFQARTYGSNVADLAPSPLLTVPSSTLQGPTISKLRALYDNYEVDSSVAETVTNAERSENAAFLDAIVATQVMTQTRRFLVEKNMLSNDPGALRTLLDELWFTMFPRAGGRSQIGSSSFEHVFLGEVHRGEVSGFHNWVFFATEESSGKVNYRGYIRRVDLGGKGAVVKHSFQWGNATKPTGSMFIGTSPELEMALYTVCFLARAGERCTIRPAGQPFSIKTYPFTYHGKQYIGTAYPDI